MTGIPETMVCRIFMFILCHTRIYHIVTYHTTYHVRILVFMWSFGPPYFNQADPEKVKEFRASLAGTQGSCLLGHW